MNGMGYLSNNLNPIDKLSLRKVVNDSKPVHVVAIPYPAQGHIVPLMHLCKQLASLGGFTITFVNTEHIHARMLQAASLTFEDGDERGNGPLSLGDGNIRLVSIPGGLPPELHGEAEHVVAALQASEALSTPFDDLLHKLNLEGPPVTHIISDAMMSWTQLSADRLGIPCLAFWTSSATAFYVIWHMFHLVMLNNLPSFKAGLQEDMSMVSWIPGLPPVDIDELPAVLHCDPADFSYQFLIRQLRSLQRAACILMNTFYELEDQILSALQHMATAPPILAIGPLLPPSLLDVIRMTNSKPISKPSEQNGTDITNHTHASSSQAMGSHMCAKKPYPCIGGSIFNADAGCLRWLDGRSAGSVLYISFGSLFRMEEEQFKELAAGVEASSKAFLWSIRPDFVEGGHYAEKLPPSFAESTRERGMMLPWVPQIEVLSHPSVGGFLTHCGWNSMLESVCMGVPMLCWPDAGERRTNGLLAIHLWQTGFDFTLPKALSVPPLISRYEVERVIDLLMMGGQPCVRSNATSLRGTALLSLRQGGSSSHSLQLLLTQMTHPVTGPFKVTL